LSQLQLPLLHGQALLCLELCSPIATVVAEVSPSAAGRVEVRHTVRCQSQNTLR
jgi:hypothetical protein